MLHNWYYKSITRNINKNIILYDLLSMIYTTKFFNKRSYHSIFFKNYVNISTHKKCIGNIQKVASIIDFKKQAFLMLFFKSQAITIQAEVEMLKLKNLYCLIIYVIQYKSLLLILQQFGNINIRIWWFGCKQKLYFVWHTR